jgi:hypothetical protein
MSFTNAYAIASTFDGKVTLALVHSGNTRSAITKFLFNHHVHAVDCECKKILKRDHVNVYEVFATIPFQLYVRKINIKDDFNSFDDLLSHATASGNTSNSQNYSGMISGHIPDILTLESLNPKTT